MDSDRGDLRGGPLLMAPRGDRALADRDRGKPRPNPRRRGGPANDRIRPHGTRARNDYMTNNMQGPMRLLTKPTDRYPVIPGSISIMQRDSSSTGGTETPVSPQIHSPDNMLLHPPSSAAGGSHGNHLPTFGNLQESSGGSKKLSRRPPDVITSSPSNYTPLQPSSSRGRMDNTTFTRVESSGFLTSMVPNETVMMKLINRTLHWEDKGTDYLMDQSDFLVVGSLGRQGVGKSTIMSVLAGTRTGSGRPYLFRTQPKDVQESGKYETTGIDMAITSERIILLDTQPILSEAMLDQHCSDGLIPNGTTPDTYLDVVSLQLAIFLLNVCHVVVVVMESGDFDIILRFLWIAEKLKMSCKTVDPIDTSDGPVHDYFPQLVFVLNHATPDDFQPAALKELHSLLAENFTNSKMSVAGGVSLARSGLVPVGRLIPPAQREWIGVVKQTSNEIEECNINLHLLPTNNNPQDSFGAHCVENNDREDAGLNPTLSLLPMYHGHPGFQLLAETFRNQIFMMPRPSIRPTRNLTLPTPQPMFERDWYEYAHRTWMAIKKSNIATEHKKLLVQHQS